jgi:hypothetical protein
MPSVFNAQISEFGEFYQINNIIFSDAKYILPNAKYIALPNQVALKLKYELNNGKLITIKKELADNPKSKDIPLDDFEIKEPDTLAMKKSSVKAKAKQRISAYTALINAYDMFEFFIISAKLQAGGFNIFDPDKKEEVYLSIIETGNEYLISELERFLETKDTFEKMMRKYRNIKQYFREIDDAETDEELKDVIESNKGWLIN